MNFTLQKQTLGFRALHFVNPRQSCSTAYNSVHEVLGRTNYLYLYRSSRFSHKFYITLSNRFEFVHSTADDWPKVLSLRNLLVRSVQHLVIYTKMFVYMSSFRIRLMTSSLVSTNRVTALEPYIAFIKDY